VKKTNTNNGRKESRLDCTSYSRPRSHYTKSKFKKSKLKSDFTKTVGRTIAQAVSRQLLTAEARFTPRAVHVGFLVDKVALRRFSPVNTIPLMFHIYSCIIWGMERNGGKPRNVCATMADLMAEIRTKAHRVRKQGRLVM
jgi:hypothetical protein